MRRLLVLYIHHPTSNAKLIGEYKTFLTKGKIVHRESPGSWVWNNRPTKKKKGLVFFYFFTCWPFNPTRITITSHTYKKVNFLLVCKACKDVNNQMIMPTKASALLKSGVRKGKKLEVPCIVTYCIAHPSTGLYIAR
jgi:hypothetical protein